VHLVTYHAGAEQAAAPGEPAALPARMPLHRIPGIIPYRRFRAGPDWRKPLLDVLLAVKLIQTVRRERIDIIHAHNYEAALAGFCARCLTGCPVLFHTHGVMADELHTYFKSRPARAAARAAASALDAVLARWPDHIIAVAPEVEAFFLGRGVPRDRIDYVPPGIYYPQPSGQPQEELKELSGHAGPLILYTGNLDRYQNIELLLRSFALVARQEPDARLALLTNCPAESLHGFCQELEIMQNVFFVPFRCFAQEQAWLARAQVAVLPRTSWSGFPIKLLNYMAAGKAVVACEGSAKGIEHLTDGLIVSNDDAPAFAGAMLLLLRDPDLRARLGFNAKRKAEQQYGWDRIAGQIELIYGRMLERRRAGRRR
jgi:glycosyltransferase involved in cell wall biosynthesis